MSTAPATHGPVVTTRQGRVALILADNPPVNALAQPVREGLLRAVQEAAADPAVDALAIACEGRTFFAGAEIREFGKPPVPPGLGEVLDAIEACPKPVVAAIHGTALGGGFELALACHARIADAKAAVGLPEVKLGIIPGAGGTQRVPRLAGPVAALEMIASGRHVRAEEARRLGLIDAVAESDLRAEAVELARSLVGRPPRRTGELPVPAFDPAAFDAAAAAVAAKARSQVSPIRAIEAVRLTAGGAGIREGLAAERAIFRELVGSDQAKALRYAFFSEREVQRVPHLQGVAPRQVDVVGVIGAGTMGAGIAVALLDAGLRVVVTETSIEAVGAGWDRISGLYGRAMKSGRIDQAKRDERLSRLSVTDDFAELAACDLVIEAAFEDMAVKQEIFGRLGSVARPGATLATNTSYLDVDAIGRASGRPEDVIGLHFFSPANIMRLVEVVEGAASAKDAVATGVALAKRMGKLPVTCGVCDGFVGNRILATWRQQTDFALEDGALPQEVDAALERYGFAMGPFAVADLAGLDIGWARRKRLAPTRDPGRRYGGTVADRLCAMGRFGQKTGAGYYRYVDGKRQVDPEVTRLVEDVSAELGRERRPFDPNAMVRHVRAAMVNEGAKILAEGVVPRALDIDMVLLHGYGFPAWRGGPMFEADAIGLATILADMRELHALSGPGWEPAPLLVELAEKGGTFAGYSRTPG
ncbi:3-hydroxyacyl-CoA dehydrogenase NAD-binding domain-containing protein [Alsobacter sp. KACC 23698]|uniref:3-hydroxyacyl-CoA dehydrogenase NAD-binding domain-containing protein n=1 Tax=Alsobacter sp. KACC 23698 TaxID=3149229 RepID=A0AAU7JCG1_9HYPH